MTRRLGTLVRRARRPVPAILLAVTMCAQVGTGHLPPLRPRATPTPSPSQPTPSASAEPLAGRVVVVDPGHQLGNASHPREINRLVDARGLRKECNSTGTATNGGYPEATFTWEVATRVRDRLRALGATVVMTRDANRHDLWGPCVDVRGKAGDARRDGLARPADALISIHGDGASSSAHGFHLILSTYSGLPARTRSESETLATRTRAALERAGFDRSSYIGRGTALSYRSDLGTLNWATPPAIMGELGNMRNAGDAAAMTSTAGQTRYAEALVAGVRSFLTSRPR